MILGIGIDIAAIERVSSVYARYGFRFSSRILTNYELSSLPENPAAYLASRFAAKEAAVKALGTGFALGISPRQIEIRSQSTGKPLLYFNGAALERAQMLGAHKFHLSLTHERAYAIAMVILED